MTLAFRDMFPLGVRLEPQTIGRCGAMLPNHMQCTKSGTWEVTDDSKTPPTVTQYCTYHAKILEEENKRNPQAPAHESLAAAQQPTNAPNDLGKVTTEEVVAAQTDPASVVKPTETETKQTEQQSEPKPNDTKSNFTKPPITPK